MKKYKNKRQISRSYYGKDTPSKTRNHIVNVHMPLSQPLPDEIRVKIPMTMSVTNAFNTAAAYGNILFNGNSLYDIITTGSISSITPYLRGYAENYQRYRVEKSYCNITCASREATENQFLLLTPTISSAGLGTASAFASYSALPFTKNTVIGPYPSGQSIAALTQQIDFVKLIGPHYRTQDEYAGTCTGAGAVAAPSTLIYWLFGYSNPDTNTVTTGGLNYQIMMEQEVVFYQPVRDTAADFLEPSSLPLSKAEEDMLSRLVQRRSQ